MPVMMKMTPRPPIKMGRTMSPPELPEPELADGPPWLGMPPGGVGEGVGEGVGDGDGLGLGDGDGDGLGEGLGEGLGVGERPGEVVASSVAPDAPFCGANA